MDDGKPATDIPLRYYISSVKLNAKRCWKRAYRIVVALVAGCGQAGKQAPHRREQASENIAAIRHVALNVLNGEISFKAGIKRKQKRAIRNDAYLS